MNRNDPFDNLAAWRSNQDQPWNRLRYQMVEANLRRCIGGQAALHVLDAGGGDGRDALALARLGHHVLIIDRAPTLLAAAQRSAAAAGLAHHIRTQAADIAGGDLPCDKAGFDLVLCHNVLQYLDEPQHLLRALARSLRAGGLLSLLIPNPASETLRLAIRQHNFDAALASLDAETHRNLFYGVDMQLYDLQTLWSMVADVGLARVAYFGVRCINDYIVDDQVKFSAAGFDHLAALEQAMGARSPYRDVARMWQIIAQKPGDEQG